MSKITKLEVVALTENAPAAISVDPRTQKRFVFHETPPRHLTVALLQIVLPLLMDREISGIEHLPAKGPVVLAANHLTSYDVFPIQLCLPRPLFFMAKAELYKNVLMDAYLRQLGAFPVNRGERDEWALAHARRVLDHGQVLAIFPEGTRNQGRGLRPAKTGAARFARYANCPIVPVAISGIEKMFQKFPKRTPITIKIGEPIYPQEGESTLALTDRLMFTLAEMLPPKQRGVYAERPPGFY